MGSKLAVSASSYLFEKPCPMFEEGLSPISITCETMSESHSKDLMWTTAR